MLSVNDKMFAELFATKNIRGMGKWMEKNGMKYWDGYAWCFTDIIKTKFMERTFTTIYEYELYPLHRSMKLNNKHYILDEYKHIGMPEDEPKKWVIHG